MLPRHDAGLKTFFEDSKHGSSLAVSQQFSAQSRLLKADR
jgi:hypothetical protein